jgi:hypothetical protein
MTKERGRRKKEERESKGIADTVDELRFQCT